MSSTNRGGKREDQDLYSTPDYAFKPILSFLPKRVNFWEPARGDGRLITWLNESGRVAGGDDLSNGYDFLKDRSTRSFIITNPPFSLAREFVAHSREVADETMMLLRLNFLGAQYRKAWWKENEPDAIFVLSKRPSFVKGGSDSCEYGWFYWGFRYKGIQHP